MMQRIVNSLMLVLLLAWATESASAQLASRTLLRDIGRDTSRFIVTPTALMTEKMISTRLQDSLFLVRERMEQIYALLDGIDRYSYNFSGLRSWRINDYEFQDVLRDAVFRVTRDSNMILEKSDIQVIATPPPHNDLVAVYFGENELQGKRLREVLTNDENIPLRLRQRLIASGQFGQDRELVDRGFKIDNLLPPMLVTESDSILGNFARYNLSLDQRTEPTVLNVRLFDNASIRFGNDWGAELKLGNDELGYPMWTSGNLAVMALYKRIKLGVQLPFAGATEGSTFLGMRVRPRRLDGTYGVTGEFDFAFVGGSFAFSNRRTDTDGTFADPENIYSVRTFGQLWYSYTLSINNKANLMRVKFGAGMHSVAHDAMVEREGRTEITPIDHTRFFWSPYLKVEFMNQQFSNRFGASLQYYKEWGLATMWLEIINNTLRIELKGAAPLLRSRSAWEPSHFVAIMIPYTVSF
ncbi:MAG: hypothetical protein HY961_00430 [Ignavibacteriae bacterium]|nr:hypothetical protein [Ignavibacteriota bacterium]